MPRGESVGRGTATVKYNNNPYRLRSTAANLDSLVLRTVPSALVLPLGVLLPRPLEQLLSLEEPSAWKFFRKSMFMLRGWDSFTYTQCIIIYITYLAMKQTTWKITSRIRFVRRWDDIAFLCIHFILLGVHFTHVSRQLRASVTDVCVAQSVQ